MSTLAQVPGTRVDDKVLALPWLPRSQPLATKVGVLSSVLNQHTFYLDNIMDSSVLGIAENALAQDRSRLVDSYGRGLSVCRRLATLTLGWDVFRYNGAPDELRRTLDVINEMATWGATQQDQLDDVALAPGALEQAISWVTSMYFTVVSVGHEWAQPNVSIGPLGEATLSWRHRNKRLIVYVSGDTAEYLQAWGPNTETEMAEGSATPPEKLLPLWLWLSE